MRTARPCLDTRWTLLLILASMAAMTGPAAAQSPQNDVRRQEKLAAAGDVAAMRRVGISYAMGRGVAKNEQKAFQWMSRAAKAGDAEAMYYLWRFYQRGEGVAANQALATQWLRKSQIAGFSPNSSKDTPKKPPAARPDPSKNLQLAFQKYERAAAAGDSEAMAVLGSFYMHGQGTPRDVVKAAEMYQKGADAGNRRCAHELGLCYVNGVGVKQDLAKAFALFKSGAEALDPDSMHDLAMCYYHGKGVKANRAEAQKWLAKAAKTGHRPSQQALASIDRANKAPAASKRPSTEQVVVAVGLLWAFSQMMGSSTSPADEAAEREEKFNRHIEQQAEKDFQESEARIRAREQGVN